MTLDLYGLFLRMFISMHSFGAGTDLRRQNLTSKVDHCNKIVKYLYWPLTHNIGIQMNRKELTKTFMMISK